MAKLKGVAPSSAANISRTGMTRQEIFERSDRLRQELLALIQSNGPTTIRVLAGRMKLSYDAVRSYGNHLVVIGAAEKRKVGMDTEYTATGLPYKDIRKQSSVKCTDKEETNATPHLRIIRLLDRKPYEVSKDEHNANRRSVKSAVRGSSMAMFDGF